MCFKFKNIHYVYLLASPNTQYNNEMVHPAILECMNC